MLRSLGITDTDILDVITMEEEDMSRDIRDDIEHLLDLRPTLSTMTACGNLGGNVDVNNLIENIPVIPYWKLSDGILRVEGYAKDDSTKWVHRGICRKYLIRKNPGKGPFKNAATFYVRIYDTEMDEYKEPSIKVFHNGGFQITGVRTPKQMKYSIGLLVDAIQHIDGGFIEEGAPFPERAFQEVCMMNADVRTGYTLSRSAIQRLLTSTSSLRSTYESTAYQGVNIKFFWNAGKHERRECQTGVCPCEVQCISSGKKSSIKKTAKNVKTKCTKVTIAPFQTGKIIITGAKHETQIKDAAKWILQFIVDNYSEIIGPPITKPERTHIPDPMRKSYPFVVSISPDTIVSSDWRE
jgi:TATA-box binding protein (TBP) (component of TFIID and TFIIIB)